MQPLLTLADTRPDERGPMDRTDGEFFVRLVMAEMGRSEIRSGASLAAEFGSGPLALAIMVKRLAVAEPDTLRFSLQAVFFLASLCRTPVDSVLWAHYLVTAARRGELVTTATLAQDFPFGFPTEAGLQRIWSAQKRPDCPAGNALDTSDAWKAAA